MKNNKLGLIFKVKKETLAFPVSENTTITANIINFCFQHLILKSKFTKMTHVSDLLHFQGLERMANQCTMSGQILVDDWTDSQVLKSRPFIG